VNYKSPLCSCIICRQTKSVKGIFSHYLHQHGSDEERLKMNKGSKASNPNRNLINKIRAENRRQSYKLKPNHCTQCAHELVYEKRGNKFCSSSCAAIYNNINHEPGRKFGPDRKNPVRVTTKREKKPKIPKSKIIRPVKFVWKNHVVGPYSKLFFCTCHHCDLKFVSRKIFRYCEDHRNLYVRSRNVYQFTFNVFHFPDLFDLSLIEKHGWYSAGNKGAPKNNQGVSRDHRVSVRDAIKNGYDPYYIKHPLNCELMLHESNKVKYTKSSLSYYDLVRMVNEYELARGSGNDPHPLYQQTDSLAGCS